MALLSTLDSTSRRGRPLNKGLVAPRQHGKKLECESLCPNEEKQKARAGSHRQDGIYE